MSPLYPVRRLPKRSGPGGTPDGPLGEDTVVYGETEMMFVGKEPFKLR